MNPSITPAYFLEHANLVFLLVATIIFYLGARSLYLKTNKFLLLQPMLLATTLLVVFIAYLDIPIDRYEKSTSLLTALIAPLTIALMIPLYNYLGEIKKLLLPILVTLFIGSIFTIAITLLVAGNR